MQPRRPPPPPPPRRTPPPPPPPPVDDFTTEEAPREILWEDVNGKLAVIARVRPQRKRIEPPPPPKKKAVAAPRVADWQIERELGRGGMAIVYAVSHRGFGERAALKLCHTSIDGGGLGAKVFLREAHIVQLIDHPAMPDVYATGVHQGRPYLVMERLTGETLAQRLGRGALEHPQAIEILLDVCDVLEVAHERNVIHRDLKLDNIFVLEHPNERGARIKLLDWGCARLLDEDDPTSGMIVGTLSYVAPEQVDGSITPASDVYSLGVLAYRMLLGRFPFAGTNDADLVQQHIFEPPPDPALLWPAIPARLAELLRAMLAKDPADRPTLDAIRATLRAARSGTPPVKSSLAQRVVTVGFGIGIACAIAGAAAMLSS